MTTELLDDPQAGAKPKTNTVKLRSAHDFSLTAKALELRVADLRKLAGKNKDEGYPREAKTQTADADAIDHFILPAFREQGELPLITDEMLAKEIEAALRPMIFEGFSGLGDPKVVVTVSGIEQRRTTLLKRLTDRLMQFTQELADEAYNQGLAAREHTAPAMAVRVIGSLRASSL